MKLNIDDEYLPLLALHDLENRGFFMHILCPEAGPFNILTLHPPLITKPSNWVLSINLNSCKESSGLGLISVVNPFNEWIYLP